MTIQQLFLATLPDVVFVFTGAAGSLTAPIGYNAVTVEAIGSGGVGTAGNNTGTRAGGGGGQYAISDSRISVTGGSTIVYYLAGGSGTDSWSNVGTNAVPTSSTTGCLAKGGSNASGGTPGVGNLAGSIGATTRTGGNGAAGNSGGGGGAGASTAGGNAAGATGGTAGTDTTGLSATLMAGGTGGNYQVGGANPGGGAGANTNQGGQLSGGAGRVRIRFTQY